ncbi:DNA-packaging protein [Novosphingobium sp. TCA1]|uniref:ATP-binding protein n=1 Tax=Novosphingobium pentaromativorans TaxID=205844 RepID=A0A2W5QMS4_9SPHN|nr:MAG: ATP-binding protein [Novosphingobium pentaromativorans]GFE73194.1 DNA-packaging protein [Novosphingobium sp. TCA1]
MAEADPLTWLTQAEDGELEHFMARLGPSGQREWRWDWRLWARPSQIAPEGDWRVWLVMAGRGFGKTRCGAEWVNEIAESRPDARIALVAAHLGEARAVMVEGESGLLSVGAPWRRPVFEPSLRRLTWPNGAQAMLYSAAEPESLRGPQHSHAWCDEVAKWDNASARAVAAWDNLLMGLRLGRDPRVVATTTPRSVPLVMRLLSESENGEVAVTRGSTFDNAVNLPRRFLDAMRTTFSRSLLGRQEIDGEMIADIEGALWNRTLLEDCREHGAPTCARVVVGVDPPASAGGDACGIVVVGLGTDGMAHVMADASVEKAGPERWARAVAGTAEAWQADRVVAEANQGGAMVASVLRAARLSLPLRLVHASRGKVARAEPVAALYEAGRVHHAGMFPRLEDEMCGLIAGGAYQGPGRSPDRADALVWALTELMLGTGGAPRVSLA